ncbi:MAG TPA: 4Fe-4S binding protein, partial [Candidatus Deferrimicrobium sp.]|nr:4Fe-4S binding protein [Candidatus Deferrimicrobium sp.]
MADVELNKSETAAEEKKTPRIGVFVCHCGTNIAGVVDPVEVAKYAKTLPNVIVAEENRFMCSDPGQNLIKEKMKEQGLDRVIVAACSPRLHEPTFRNVIKDMDLNEFYFEQANIREHNTWCHQRDPEKALQVAKDLVRAAVGRASMLESIDYREIPVTQKAIVVGGGISGIFSALDIADMGFKTYLVEKTPSIGGHMAQLDKTFPTLDCSMCILTPKMVEVARNPNIEIMSYSEVDDVHGFVGNFKVTVRKKARYINAEKCNGCGKCVEICPVYVPNEYNERLNARRAIYVPLAQAVPNTFTIDKDRCIECHLCDRICELKAVDFSQKDELIELEVGAIVLATGYDQMRVNEPEYGLEQYKYG